MHGPKSNNLRILQLEIEDSFTNVYDYPPVRDLRSKPFTPHILLWLYKGICKYWSPTYNVYTEGFFAFKDKVFADTSKTSLRILLRSSSR